MIVSWFMGFCVYEWLAQTAGLGFWTRFLAQLHPPANGGIGASLPGFATAFVLAFAVARVRSVGATTRRDRASLA
jgi:hypothetical protein